MNKKHFANTVKIEFYYLQSRYGFSPPIIKDFGRELSIKFERKSQTISITLEIGGSPLIEIFCPSSETGDKPTPWASKNGIDRSRRFPEMNLKTKFLQEDENSVTNYIREMSILFEETEAQWLAA